MDEEPVSYQGLAIGTEVLCADGSSIGTVEHVLQEPDMDLFDGIVVKTQDGVRFVDREQITTITTRKVTTTLSPAEVAKLPKPESDEVYRVNAFQDEGPALTARFGRMFRRSHWTRDPDE